MDMYPLAIQELTGGYQTVPTPPPPSFSQGVGKKHVERARVKCTINSNIFVKKM